jgi:ABC-type uncharacterized transport system permease subunit
MTLVTLIFIATSALYAASCGLFFIHLVRGGKRAVVWASRVLGVAIAAHCGFLVINYVTFGRAPISDIHEVLAIASLLLSLGYLVTMSAHRLTVLGAFITPVTLLLFLGASLGGRVTDVPDAVRSAMLPLHVAVNVLGVVAFALASAAATAYLIQERLLRHRDVVGVFQRLPALDVLDSLGFKMVVAGFPLFTVGLLTGTLWVARDHQTLDARQYFAALAWVFFASVLLARAAAGWRGRRAAIGTMLGFLCTMAALGGYLLRGIQGS